MKYSVLLLPLLVVACAHSDKKEKVVQFPYAEELVEKVQKVAVRAPASELSVKEEKSPRRTYFVTLYHQYLTFSHYLGKENDLAFCPQFHHDKLETEAISVPKVTFFKNPKVGNDGRAYFPESVFKKNFSLEDYHADIRDELATLCEEGVSDNFYKFDNLITHYADKASFHKNTKAMASVLKIPVFANFYLLKMMDTEKKQKFSHPEEKRFIELTRTHWFPEYVREAGKRRNSFLDNKLVTR
ncbi:MAG: hypothetical protein ACJ76H_01695 [Bacteriovoracaceae bacterium]